MKTSKYALAVGLGVIALAARPAHADILTTYTINFTTTSGSPTPASGSFTYDSTNAQFTSFIVKWDGFSFDMTSSANNPLMGTTGCPGDASTPLYGFELITQTIPTPCGPATPSYIWGATTPGPGAYFGFEAFANLHADTIGETIHDLGVNPADAAGSWTVSTATVSEPPSVILLGSGLLGLMAAARRKFLLG